MRVVAIAILALTCGCVNTRRAIGEDCLKDDDCLSGVCSELKCAPASPLLDGSPTYDGAAGDAAGEDATGGDAGADADASTGDASGDAPADGPRDALEM